MKISICIPQYNRIEYLKINLEKIALQKDTNLEVIISDDASTDDTARQIAEIQKTYPFPLTYHKFERNVGYDRNLRKSLELASGDYCFILGNDDTLRNDLVINELSFFLKNNNFPDVGFCNSADYLNKNNLQIRAQQTKNIGSGAEIALKYYSSFSFVAGLIFKKSAFDSVNTSKLDGSV
ncbi:MAG: glycosyltransferase family 2 protein [Pedobacter sp.]|nr:MAG: glycosyltransferase family 2 protein [Pedobacter sp.]